MNSKYLLDRINWIVTFASVIVAIIVGFSEDSFQKLFSKEINTLTYFLIMVFSALTLLISNYFRDIELKKQNSINIELENKLKTELEEKRKLKFQLENSNRLIYDIEIEKNTDVITGIPNQAMFKKDVKRITNSIKQGELYQILFIDIDNFGSINQDFGFFKGDEFIRSIAEELFYTMRRNESIYKNKFISNEEPLTDSIYRKYNGGDEFIITLKGTQEDAIGFLIRLNRQLKQFAEKTVFILGKHFTINFHAGIAPLFGNDDFFTALSRVEDCYRIAKRKDSKSRVKWFKKAEDLETNSIYQNAIKEFEK